MNIETNNTKKVLAEITLKIKPIFKNANTISKIDSALINFNKKLFIFCTP